MLPSKLFVSFSLAPVVGTLVMFFSRAGWLRDRLADLTAILVLLAKAGAAQPAFGMGNNPVYGSSPSDLPTASCSHLGPTVPLPCTAVRGRQPRSLLSCRSHPACGAKGSMTHMGLPPMSNSVGLSRLSQLGQLRGRAAASLARDEIGHSVPRTWAKTGD